MVLTAAIRGRYRLGVSPTAQTPAELLHTALTMIDDQLEQLRSERSRLQEEFNSCVAPLDQDITRLEASRVHQVHALTALESQPAIQPPRSDLPPTANGEVPRKLTDVAELILREAGKPVHYKEVAAEVVRRGVYISAKDPGAFVISYLRREPQRFCRTGVAGEYALVDWGLEDSRSMMTIKKPQTKRRASKGGRKR